ncbi:hypothetical protein JOD24_000742 [Kroppenstedtia sanguinis]|uniref:DUF4430 domain-containing protein n=1 Tax=Kroppenstedtia sanguinis TaxID=1380684 RepID=UPI003D1B8C91
MKEMYLFQKWLSTVFALILFLTAFPVAVLGETLPVVPGETGEQAADMVQLSVTGDDHREMYPATPVEIEADETAFSVLLKTLGPEQMTYTGSGSSLYVRAIGDLAEFDRGPLSGWMFRVNGEFPAHSAGSHPVKNGDVVEWVYTTDGGEDVGLPLSRTDGEGNNRLREAPKAPPSGTEPDAPVKSKPRSDGASNLPREKAFGESRRTLGTQEHSGKEVQATTSAKTASVKKRDLTQAVADVAGWISAEGSGSDWQALGLFQAVEKVPVNYLENTIRHIVENEGEFRKVTDVERLVLGIRAGGGDPRSIDKYNLIEKICNHKGMLTQGSNGVIFALIALDSARYFVPDGAEWNREGLLNWLLENQNRDGSWALVVGSSGDVDLTAMALAALAPYDGGAVDQAKQRGFGWLSAQQTESGGFRSWGVENSESASQVIIALTSNGMDPHSNAFTKSGGNVVENLLSYQQKDGGFAHVGEEKSNDMASEQALLALTSYRNFLEGKPRIYDLGDINASPGEGKNPDVKPAPEGEKKEKPSPSRTGSGVVEPSRTLPTSPLLAIGGGPAEEIDLRPALDSGPSMERSGVTPTSSRQENPAKAGPEDESTTLQALAAPAPEDPGASETVSSSHRGYVMILLGVLCAFVGAGFYLYERRRKWQ